MCGAERSRKRVCGVVGPLTIERCEDDWGFVSLQPQGGGVDLARLP